MSVGWRTAMSQWKRGYMAAPKCGTDVHGGTAIVGNIPLFGERNYTYDFIVPEKVEIKSYRDSLDCRVSFPVAHHELQKRIWR